MVKPRKSASQKRKHTPTFEDNLSQGVSVNSHYAKSIKKMAFIIVCFAGLVYFTGGGGFSSDALKGNLFDEGGDDLSSEASQSGTIKTSGGLEVSKFFPPKKLRFDNWKGESQDFPFFQRSRNFVPRFRIPTDLASGWEATFTLVSEDESVKPLVRTTKEASAGGVVKERFSQLPAGKYALQVVIKDKKGKTLKEVTHNEIWILDKSVALLGDDIFSGVGQGADNAEELTKNLFAKGTGIDAYVEKSFRKEGQIVFPINLAEPGQTPGQFLDNWINDGRKDYIFSIDGQQENESFLKVDEIWLGFFHTILKQNWTVEDYILQIAGIVEQLNQRGIQSENIVVIEPPFSAEYNMKDYVLALRAKVGELGVRSGPAVYELSRDEYGRLVSFENEPQLTAKGMDSLGLWLVEKDLGKGEVVPEVKDEPVKPPQDSEDSAFNE